MFERYRKGGWNPSRLAEGCRFGKRFSSFGRTNRGFLAPDITRREQKYTAKIYIVVGALSREKSFPRKSTVSRYFPFLSSCHTEYSRIARHLVYSVRIRNIQSWIIDIIPGDWIIDTVWPNLSVTVGYISRFLFFFPREFILKKFYYDGDYYWEIV